MPSRSWGRSEPWPEPENPDSAEYALSLFQEAGGDIRAEGVRGLLTTLATHAPPLLAHVAGDPPLAEDILRQSLGHGDDPRALLQELDDRARQLDDGPELRRLLRRTRHRSLIRIALREILGLADVDRTSAEIAWLADTLVKVAIRGCERTLQRTVGQPLLGDRPIPFTVLGMGKLGGEELNMGSDIDLCFFYETDEGRVSGSDITPHEYFVRLVQRTTRMLTEVTEDGFCFRVDLRLRPEGTAGPLASSLASAERYYETWGRTWERVAMLRARPIAGDPHFGQAFLDSIRPFVFRHRVEPRVAAEMALMMKNTRRELRVDEERNIKLGRGGIREAEFFVQTLQLIWGGRHPELQVRNTVEAVRRLRGLGLVSDRETEVLERDWSLLRRIEHRIHARLGYQTHSIPDGPPEIGPFARSLGFDDEKSFRSALADARRNIAELFDSLTPGDPDDDLRFVSLAQRITTGEDIRTLEEDAKSLLGIADADEALSHLRRLRRRPDSLLGLQTRREYPELGPLLLREISEATNPDTALRYVAEFASRMGGQWGYDRLFSESPRLLRRLVALFGTSPGLAQALVQHPESLNPILLAEGVTKEEIVDAHHPLQELENPEDFIASLRRIKREMTVRIGLAAVSGEASGPVTESHLTCLAECQVRAATDFALRDQQRTWGTPSSALTVVGMGSLGAGEMTFGSDLDLLFLFGEDGPVAIPSAKDS
ncbi:MAG: hypothetical protein KC416_08160, partial [Myxococcales bacterium]|nr:hypothetical protein [Myxococcales bacterium]